MKVQIQKLDAPNKNGRVYSTEVIQEAIKAKGDNPILGTFGMPETSLVNLTDVSHVVRNLTIEDGYLVGEVTVLKTPRGEILEKVLDEMVFRTSGTGNVDDDGNITDFHILTVAAIHKDTAA